MEKNLYESAPLALKSAPDLCYHSASKGHSCAWYHGVWQYFRILGIVGSPWKQHLFFEENLRHLARTGDYRKVLISGSSDYAMMAVVMEAFRQENIDPEITVVDRCETPLYLNRWYAERNAIKLQTHTVNFLEYSSNEPFDLICTHSFMGYFRPEERMSLFANWGKNLRSGGKLITVNRIRPGAEGPLGFSPSQAENFRKKALEAGKQKCKKLGITLETLEEWLSVYTERYSTNPVTSQEELFKLFRVNDFTLDHTHTEGTYGGETSGPSVPGQAMHLNLVANRL